MRPSASRRSRVTPGVSSTSAILRPTSRLNSVDLPTLGRPTMATSAPIGWPPALRRGGRNLRGRFRGYSRYRRFGRSLGRRRDRRLYRRIGDYGRGALRQELLYIDLDKALQVARGERIGEDLLERGHRRV